MGCSGYPECKTIIRPQAATVDVPCPKCGGEVQQKRSKKGAIFYGCANFPTCDFVAWGKPIGRACPDCGNPLVENTFKGRVIGIRCSSKDCAHKEPLARKAKGDEPEPSPELAVAA
jgi:DNA topoisomerase-1